MTAWTPLDRAGTGGTPDAVAGPTGQQSGAVARSLLERDVAVRALAAEAAR